MPQSRKGVFVRLSVEFFLVPWVCPPLPSHRGLSQAYTLRLCPLLPLGQNMHSSSNKPLTVQLTCVLALKYTTCIVSGGEMSLMVTV